MLKSLLNRAKQINNLLTNSILTQIAKVISNLPVSSEVIGPPRGYYETTADGIKALNERNTLSKRTYTEIVLNNTVCKTAPKSLDSRVHWKFDRAAKYNLPIRPIFVATIPMGRVWSDSAVITEDDHILGDLSFHGGLSDGIKSHVIFTKLKLRSSYYIKDTAALLTAHGGQNYFHWMFDVLPRIGILQLAGFSVETIDKFIVNSTSYSFQEETLKYIGISYEKLISSQEHSHIKVNKLIAPALLRGFEKGNIAEKYACLYLRESLLKYERFTTRAVERIYITRADASYRKVLNEEDVIALVAQIGFSAVTLNSLTVAEQISIFKKAKIIIAPHGAGLTNIVFSSPGTILIEILSPVYVNVCYWSIANHLNIKYYYLLGEGETHKEHEEKPVRYPYKENIKVNLKSLLDTIKFAEI